MCLPSLSVPSHLPSPSPTNYMGWLTRKAEWGSGPGNSSLAQAPEASSTCNVSLPFPSLLLHPYQWLPNSQKGLNPMSASLTVPIVHPATSPSSAHPGLSPYSILQAFLPRRSECLSASALGVAASETPVHALLCPHHFLPFLLPILTLTDYSLLDRIHTKFVP